MTDEFDRLRVRLGELIEELEIADDVRMAASAALEELEVMIEELEAQHAELDAASRELARERERYRVLFDLVPDGFFVTDDRGVIREANEGAVSLLRRPLDELVGKPLVVFVDDDSAALLYPLIGRLRRAQAGTHEHIDVTLRDHGAIPVNLRGSVGGPIEADDRRLTWLVHDRREARALEELRARESQLRAMFDAVGVGVVLRDAQGILAFSNRVADELSAGTPRERTVIATMLGSVHVDDRAALREMMLGALREGRAGSMRYRVLGAGGAERWVYHSVVATRDSDGTLAGTLSTLTDVTAEQTALLEAERARDFSEAVLDTVDALVVVTDTDGRIVRCNATCEDVTGLDPHETIGRTVSEVLPELRAFFGRAGEADRAIDVGQRRELEMATSDGVIRRVEWATTAVRGPDRSVWAVILTGVDVTERRLLEARVAQEDRLESIGRLATAIAHDLNNTLTAVGLNIERLAGRFAGDGGMQEIESIKRTLERSRRVVGDLLFFGRRHELVTVPVDVNEHVGRVVAMLSDLIGESIDVHVDLDDGDTTVLFDPARLDQIVTNLVINARDAMPDGGTLTIGTAIDQVDEVPPGLPGAPDVVRVGRCVKVTVVDTGVGMDDAVRSKAFDPFFTTKPPSVGTGLGLSTVYGIVKQAGGAIELDSQPGKGSTVTVWIPVDAGDHTLVG